MDRRRRLSHTPPASLRNSGRNVSRKVGSEDARGEERMETLPSRLDRLQLITDAAAIGIAYCDSDQRFLFVETGLCRAVRPDARPVRRPDGGGDGGRGGLPELPAQDRGRPGRRAPSSTRSRSTTGSSAGATFTAPIPPRSRAGRRLGGGDHRHDRAPPARAGSSAERGALPAAADGIEVPHSIVMLDSHRPRDRVDNERWRERTTGYSEARDPRPALVERVHPPTTAAARRGPFRGLANSDP